MSISSIHPIATAIYYVSVLVFPMFTLNPLLQICSLLGSFCYFLKIQSKIIKVKDFVFPCLLFLIMTFGNPLFSHNGATILFYMNSNPITAESLLYGLNVGVMLIAVLFWFRSFSVVMTEDKLLCVFGKLSPKLTLVISSSLRFVPLIKRRYETIAMAQKGLGLFSSDSWVDKIKSKLRVFNALIGWGIEKAVETGSSMRGRGYGLKNRTHYSVFRFTKQDAIIVAIILLTDFIMFYGLYSGAFAFEFYPSIVFTEYSANTIIALCAYALLSFLPLILEVKEALQWRYYRSKI